jgi:hypothetical protein
MTLVCRRNPKHAPLGPTRCMVPGCNSLLIEREDQWEIDPTIGAGPATEGENNDAPAPADPQVALLLKKVEDLLAHAAASESTARQSAATAAEHARSALAAAEQAVAQAEPHVSKLGFDEPARHVEGAQYYAAKAEAAATEAASQSAAASQAKLTLDGLIAGLGVQPGLGEIRLLFAEVEPAVTLVEKFATAAQAAAGRAESASGEVGSLRGFFLEALSLWQKLHG